jgi:hypothetical protein
MYSDQLRYSGFVACLFVFCGFISTDYIASIDKMNKNNELRRTWKETVVA